MKKNVFIAMIAVFGLTKIHAQKISFGVKAGVNLTNLYGKGQDNISGQDDNLTYTKTLGLQFGVLIEYMFYEKFGGQTEILYVKQEESYEYKGLFYTNEWGYPAYDPDVVVSDSYNLNSISIPVLAKFYPFKNFNIHVGPQINFLVSPEEKMKSTDIGVAGGIGYELDLGVFFSARFYNGFTNLVDYSEYYTYNLSSFRFSLGYKF